MRNDRPRRLSMKNCIIEIVKGFLPLYLFTLLLLSCGSDGSNFRIEGRLRHMNQGEFYVYSPDGGIMGIDTIKVHEGRFAFETMLRDEATFVVIFPNFSELAVFGEPGGTAVIKGDASHMKEMTVKGSDENEEMTQIRMEINRLTPPEIPKAVEAFIKEHRSSLASIYLLKRYIINDKEPDYRKAAILTQMMLDANPDNGQLIQLGKQLKTLRNASLKQLPKFTATDVKGRQVSEKDLKAQVNVVTLWASWSYHAGQVRLQRPASQCRCRQQRSRHSPQPDTHETRREDRRTIKGQK